MPREAGALSRIQDCDARPGTLLFGAAIGAGLTARAAEAGGADFLLALAAGRFRLQGAPSLACMLPIGDSNALVARFAREEILGRVGVPVLFGASLLDPVLVPEQLLDDIAAWGFDGVTNFPTVTYVDGRTRELLEELGLGFAREARLIERAARAGLATLAYVSSAAEACRMRDVGAAMLCVNLGFTAGVQTGLPSRLDLEQVAAHVERVLRGIGRGGPLTLIEGGPITGPAEALRVCGSCRLDGYVGGSTLDRLPLEAAVRETAAAFKSVAGLSRDLETLKEDLLGEGWRYGIIGRSEAMRGVVRQIDRAGLTSLPVLILGENGTGKELVAYALHQASPRRRRPLLAVNCAAMPRELIESELFGYEAGAFTGAMRTRIGRFEEANGSTLFLDEIGDLEPQLQAKLLRVLENGCFERLGSNVPRRTDARIVCATNRDLARMVREGSFREDLYYRLAALEIALPPLRARLSDLPLLVRDLLDGVRAEINQHLEGVGDDAMRAMMEHDWPGNVRELKHALGRAAVMTDNRFISAADLSFLHRPDEPSGSTPAARPSAAPASEREWILEALARHRWRRGDTARALGIARKTLYSKMRRHGLLDA